MCAEDTLHSLRSPTPQEVCQLVDPKLSISPPSTVVDGIRVFHVRWVLMGAHTVCRQAALVMLRGSSCFVVIHLQVLTSLLTRKFSAYLKSQKPHMRGEDACSPISHNLGCRIWNSGGCRTWCWGGGTSSEDCTSVPEHVPLQLQGGPQTFVGGLECLGEAGCTHSSVQGGTQLSPNPLGTQRTCSLQDTSDGIIWPQQITGKVATIAHAPWSRISGPQSFKTQVLPF